MILGRMCFYLLFNYRLFIFTYLLYKLYRAYAAVLKCECNRKTYTAVATQINPRELSRVPTVKSATSSKTNNLVNGEANS